MVSQSARNYSLCIIASILIGACLFQHSSVRGATQKYWELSPYRVKLHLAIDDTQRPQPQLVDQLLAELQKQIRANIYPLWSTKISVAEQLEAQRLFALLRREDAPTDEQVDLDALTAGCDKQIYLSLQATRLGTQLRCRELDCTTRRWGPVQKRLVRQAAMLPASCLDLICATFSPLATIRTIADEDSKVLLSFRGSDLPQQSDLSVFMVPGDAYQPLMVRTNSTGEIKTDSIRDISWTYLTLAERTENGWQGEVHTGTRRPFGVRRRGRIEHLALAMRNPSGSSRVRFYARHDQTQGLTGYEVFRREPEATASEPLGLTDTLGGVEIEPGEQQVTLLFLRSEGQLLAKVPVVPGARKVIEVPIADDTSRLRAQAALTSLTEQLIDTVAQRNILIARVRDRIENGKLDEAQDLFTELDSLPGRAQFDQKIQSAEQRELHRSDDPKVQARIEKLFADTRKLLGRFLSTKPISELQGELTSARRSNGG